LKREIIYVESDDHGGNRNGLMHPVKLMDEEGDDFEPELTKTQNFLLELRNANIEKLKKLAGKDDVIYLHGGDITQGMKYISDWVTTTLGHQLVIAHNNHYELFRRVKNIKIARYAHGTSSHVFGNASSEMIVIPQLQAEFPKVDIRHYPHGLIELGNDFSTDIAHHGPGRGSRKWLEGNIASYYLRDRMLQELLRGKKPPDVYLRFHYHGWAKCGWNISIDDNDYWSWLFLIPSMCGINAYGRQVTKSVSHITHGALAIELVDRKILDVHRWTVTSDLRTKERIK